MKNRRSNMLRSTFETHYAGHGMSYEQEHDDSEVAEYKGRRIKSDHVTENWHQLTPYRNHPKCHFEHEHPKQWEKLSGEVITYNIKEK